MNVIQIIIKYLIDFSFKISTLFVIFTCESTYLDKTKYNLIHEKIIYILWGILGFSVLVNLFFITITTINLNLLINFSNYFFIELIFIFLILLVSYNLFLFLIKSIENSFNYNNIKYQTNTGFLIFKNIFKFIFGTFFLYYCNIIFCCKVLENKIQLDIKKINQTEFTIFETNLNNSTIKEIIEFNTILKADLKQTTSLLKLININKQNKSIFYLQSLNQYNNSKFTLINNKIKSNQQLKNNKIAIALLKILKNNTLAKLDFKEKLKKKLHIEYKINFVKKSLLFYIIYFVNICFLFFSIFLKNILVRIDKKYLDKKNTEIKKIFN